MRKETIVKDDGRYLIYYSFGVEESSASPPAPNSGGAGGAADAGAGAAPRLGARDAPAPPELGAGGDAPTPNSGEEPEA